MCWPTCYQSGAKVIVTVFYPLAASALSLRAAVSKTFNKASTPEHHMTRTNQALNKQAGLLSGWGYLLTVINLNVGLTWMYTEVQKHGSSVSHPSNSEDQYWPTVDENLSLVSLIAIQKQSNIKILDLLNVLYFEGRQEKGGVIILVLYNWCLMSVSGANNKTGHLEAELFCQSRHLVTIPLQCGFSPNGPAGGSITA